MSNRHEYDDEDLGDIDLTIIEGDLIVLYDEGWTTDKLLMRLMYRTGLILRREKKIMATLQEVIDAQQAADDSVEAAAGRVQESLTALRDEIVRLQEALASGSGVTADDLQGLVDKATEITGEADLIGVDDAPEEPPVEEVPVEG
jgi:hypothetical protein